MLSFVGKKTNKQWIWIALDVRSRQIIAFHVGDRSGQSAKALWQSIPETYRKHAVFYTDGWCAYEGVIPEKQHRVVNKHCCITNHIERFNCTLRQRVSRLVRKSLSFSKILVNHIGAIKYFICHYNLENRVSTEIPSLASKVYRMLPRRVARESRLSLAPCRVRERTSPCLPPLRTAQTVE